MSPVLTEGIAEQILFCRALVIGQQSGVKFPRVCVKKTGHPKGRRPTYDPGTCCFDAPESAGVLQEVPALAAIGELLGGPLPG